MFDNLGEETDCDCDENTGEEVVITVVRISRIASNRDQIYSRVTKSDCDWWIVGVIEEDYDDDESDLNHNENFCDVMRMILKLMMATVTVLRMITLVMTLSTKKIILMKALYHRSTYNNFTRFLSEIEKIDFRQME